MTLDRWLTMAFGLVGILATWFFARYYYRRTDKRRIPTFVTKPQKVPLLRSELFQVGGIQVLHNTKPTGRTGIGELTVYFWNSGSLPILRDEVLESFAIRLPVPILQHRVLKSSREVVGFSVHAHSANSENELKLDFSVLEPGDGATIHIVYVGPPDVKPEFRGTCLEVGRPKVLPPDNIYFQTRAERLKGSPILVFPLMVLAGFAFAGLFIGLRWLFKLLHWEHGFELGAVVAFLGFFVSVVVGTLVYQVRRFRSTYVPPDIKP